MNTSSGARSKKIIHKAEGFDMQDMLGKVPNNANSPKRTAIRVGVVLIAVCALIALSSYHTLTTDG